MIPVTKETLEDIEKDIEFALERVHTRFYSEIDINAVGIPILLFGRADKVKRSNGTLIVEDCKFPSAKDKYVDKIEPFDDQKLQTLVYLNSYFNENGSLDPEKFYSIPYEKKVWIINIKDKDTQESINIPRLSNQGS